ncbi:MAG: hypothetical protein RJB55_120, partial [Verrucomicrobiota bacterium]
MKPCVSLLRHVRLLLLTSGLLLAGRAAAQTAAPGTIEGRVFDSVRGEYLEKARVSVEGTRLETLTDATGQYRLANVPAGTAQVKVFFTGLPVQNASVAVAAGQTAQRDFTFGAEGRRRP